MIVFYDGGCGLCHGFVRFVLRYGPADIRFAPQANPRAGTIMVRLDSGSDLIRSDAVLAVIDRFGGRWRWLVQIFRWIPRPLRDATYDLIARVRNRISKAPEQSCPIVPPELRGRFMQ